MAFRILSVSSDRALAETRAMVLRSRGYDVITAYGFADAVEICTTGEFHLIVVGHSLSVGERSALITALRGICEAPILVLERPGEDPVPGADYHLLADSGPESLLELVRRIKDASAPRPNPE